MLMELFILPIALVALFIIANRGWLQRNALKASLLKYAPLSGMDLLMAFGLMVLGAAVAGKWVGPVDVAQISPLARAKMSLQFQLCTHGMVALYLAIVLRYRNISLSQFGLSFPQGKQWLQGVLALVLGVPLLFGLSAMVVGVSSLLGIPSPKIGHDLLLAIRDAQTWLPLILLLLSTVVFAPLFEEIIFRGLMHNALASLLGTDHRWRVTLIGGGLFALIHVGVAWQTLPALFVLGIMLGWLYERNGSLWPSILMHAGFNAVNITVVLTLLKN